jgi:integrase
MHTIFHDQIDAPMRFDQALPLALAAEHARVQRREVCEQTVSMFTARCRAHLLPFFGPLALTDIRYSALLNFADACSLKGLHAATVRQLLISVRKVLNWAVVHGHLPALPVFPKIKSESTPRGGFTPKELLRLWHATKGLSSAVLPEGGYAPSHRDTQGGLFSKDMPLPVWFRWMIAFMVNSFVRPTDLRNIQHQHVQIVRGRHTYLRLKLPESKKHTETIITLKPAVRVYEALLAHATKMGHAAPTDYLFYPEVINRKTAMMIMDVQFRRVLDAAGLRTGTRGQNRTLYSLRHTAITFRLLYGQGIDLLTLAKNARTSVEMIERFYASELNAEMNVGMLQSRRQRVA